MNIRPFDYSDRDYEIVRGINDAVWPQDPLNMVNMRYYDGIRPKDRYFHRFIGEVDGVPVGSGAIHAAWWFDLPNYFQLDWSTHPDHERRGYGSAFYDFALAQLKVDGKTPETIEISAREDKPQSVAWIEKRGFTLNNRYPRSELKLAEFDMSQFASYKARAVENGFVIKPLSEIIPTDPDWQHKVYELEWIFEQDEPNPQPPTKVPFEQYVKDTLGNPGFTPATWFMALDGDRYAGMSCLWPDKVKPHSLQTGWTGVDRPYRKQGLAMAMKLHAIEYAISQPQITVIETDNHEKNWMFQINLRLGFRPIPAWLQYLKTLA